MFVCTAVKATISGKRRKHLSSVCFPFRWGAQKLLQRSTWRATVSVLLTILPPKTIHSPSTPKSPSECEQNSGKALKPNKICPHQIQLYHCSICEKVLAASKNVHKQFINSGACEKWCGWCSMETRSWGVINPAGTEWKWQKAPAS